ncbi:lysine decarboxylase [Acetobacter nitrogenifigens DSM 23921 = NBRC 105050]|uniref:Cytokinin riboside 5'-monophosphate phosphoribohydrolase n=1 Tax=Acetobacter nitrogenifigens DSM 23921 = NBRC 105050 TaxID=1120919 RepID=A0A511XCD1_9PROT|nr:TIGR00730 family Rossman fold protein [Acetobacter nitrogenifigens]GBQ93899.1 lysine decarboxylase [Acetobacter nitrogenifigens DSM 23921 = NBRC 105050]GEN60628.1 cytokinin riboside 5'-monophosphate phosphoribohydrolase [Acetobacter nitrogenifigens DSM 23921 = NBRC 105050]
MSAFISSVAVFCGSRFGNLPAYRAAAEDMGRGIAREGWRLIYGGGYVGLMGAVADAAIAAGGSVTGVIPDFLESREVMHEGVTELVVTDSMHSRKQLMFAQADAFAILPGGFGTFDEMMEIITWKQLQLHRKPILIVDVENWAAKVIAMLDAAVEQGFATPGARGLVETVPDVEAALALLRAATITPGSSDVETERL